MAKVAYLRDHARYKGLSFEPGPLFEAAWAAYPEIGRRRSSQRLSVLPWVSAAMEIGERTLLDAVRRYALEDPDALNGYVTGFHKWLRDGRWEYWVR